MPYFGVTTMIIRRATGVTLVQLAAHPCPRRITFIVDAVDLGFASS